MSVYVTRYPKILGSKDLSPGEKLVWFYLADRQGEAEMCWPAVTTIAAECGLNERATRRILGALVDKGLIERVDDLRKRDARGRSRKQYAYRVHGLDAPQRRKRRPDKLSGRAEQQALDFTEESEGANPTYPDPSVPSDLEGAQGLGANPPGSNGKGQKDDRTNCPVTEYQHRSFSPSPPDKLSVYPPPTPNYDPPMLTTQTDSARAHEAVPGGKSNGNGHDPLDLSEPERGGYLALLTGYAERFERERQCPPGDQRGHMIKLARMFVAPVAEREGRGSAQVASDLLDGVFADSWLAGRDWPLGAVVSQPARYYRPPAVRDPAEAEHDFKRKLRKLRERRQAAWEAQDHDKAEELTYEIQRFRRLDPARAGNGGGGRG